MALLDDDPAAPSVKLMVFSAFFYGVCSAMMNIVNKLLLNTWKFNFPEVILASQLLFTIGGLKLLKFFNKIKLLSYNRKSAKSCALLSVFFSSNTCLGELIKLLENPFLAFTLLFGFFIQLSNSFLTLFNTYYFNTCLVLCRTWVMLRYPSFKFITSTAHVIKKHH